MAMDLSVSAASSAYLPSQAYSQGGGVVAVSANAPQSGVVARTGAQTRSDSGQPAQTPQSAAKQSSNSDRNKAPQPATHPGYTFEVDQNNHKVMKVSDTKGVLIYQVPSKGQLALITAQEAEQKRLQLTA